jgi:transcriptional regulator with XRE-family HTH domain
MRAKDLRERLAWTQAQLADYLGLSQPAVARCEAGYAESGPVARLLDQLEDGVRAGVLRQGMSPSQAISALSPFRPNAAAAE